MPPRTQDETLRQLVASVMAERDLSGRQVERMAEEKGLQLSYVTVNNIANGKRKKVNPPTLEALAVVLNIPLDRLEAAAGVKSNDSSTDAELLALHNQLTAEEKEQALRMYRAQVQGLKSLRPPDEK